MKRNEEEGRIQIVLEQPQNKPQHKVCLGQDHVDQSNDNVQNVLNVKHPNDKLYAEHEYQEVPSTSSGIKIGSRTDRSQFVNK